MNHEDVVVVETYTFDVVAAVAAAAILATVLQFLSGLLVCKQYVFNRSTGESSPLPFLFGFTSTALWILYGNAKHDIYICFVNTIGNILMTVYLLIYFIYTIQKWTMFKKVILMIFVIVTIMKYSKNASAEDVENNLGMLASSFTMLTVAAPLSKLIHVLKVKNADCLPFPMIVTSFIVSVLWYIYGHLKDDMYLILPNLIGCLLTICQLSLFVIYRKKSSQESAFHANSSKEFAA